MELFNAASSTETDAEAVFGALIVSVVSWLLTAFLSDRGRFVIIARR